MENSKVRIDIHEKTGTIKVNPDIYPLDVIYTTSYVMLDKAYVFLQGDVEKEIEIEISPKELFNSTNKLEKEDIQEQIENLCHEFNNQLLNYAHHMKVNEKNLQTKKRLLDEIFSHTQISQAEYDSLPEEEEIEIDDPENILIPWEEKYGERKKRKD